MTFRQLVAGKLLCVQLVFVSGIHRLLWLYCKQPFKHKFLKTFFVLFDLLNIFVFK